MLLEGMDVRDAYCMHVRILLGVFVRSARAWRNIDALLLLASAHYHLFVVMNGFLILILMLLFFFLQILGAAD